MRSYDQAIEEIYKEVELRTARAAAKRRKVVKLASICTPFCVVLIIAAVLTLGGPMNITEPPVTEPPNINGDIFPSVYDFCAMYQRSICVKLEITEIHDTVYSNGQNIHFIMVEGQVLEVIDDENTYGHIIGFDENDRIKAGDKAVVPILLDASFDGETYLDKATQGELDAQEVMAWLNSFDSIYFRTEVYLSGENFFDKDDRSKVIKTIYEDCYLQGYDILPIKEGKVVIDEVNSFLNKYKVNYLDYDYYIDVERLVYNNIPCEDFEANLKSIAEEDRSGNRVDYYN